MESVVRTWRREGRIKMKKRGGKKRKISDECMSAICEYQDEHASARYLDIQAHIRQTQNADISLTTIRRVLQHPDEG
jgi:transposase